MRLWLNVVWMLLVASGVGAQEDDPEAGLVAGRLVGDPATEAAPQLRPQLVHHDRTTPVVIGATAAVIGGVSLIASWSVYIARQNYRLRYWRELSYDTVDEWETQGAWSLGLGVGAAGLLVTSEYLLLPESQDVPTLAWFAGVGGLTLAAVGVGFWLGGTHCGPEAIRPGADLRLACSAGTSDAIFGPLLTLTAVPLVNIPLTYLLRKAFAGAPESLSVTPSGVELRGRF